MNAVGFNPPYLNETLQRVEKWETSAIEQFLREVSGMLMRRKLDTLPPRESELLLQINEPVFLPETAKRYRFLYGKLQSESASADEQAELLGLSQKQEQHNLERLRCLIELAQIREMPLDTLMNQLGIETVASHG